MKCLINTLRLLYAHMTRKTEEVRYRIALFGLVMMINFPLFGVFWKIDSFQLTEEFWLRLLATLLSASLCFNYFWPKKLLPFLPFLWYCGLLYCLPFFFTYMTLINQTSTLWLMNCVTAIFFLLLLAGALDALILILIGSSLALLRFFGDSAHVALHMPEDTSLLGLLLTFGAAIFLGTFFAHDREKYYAKKLMGFNTMADHLASDLQVPLANIQLQTAKQAMALDQLEDLKLQENLKDNLKKIKKHIDMGHQLITVQLKNIKRQTWDSLTFKIYSIQILLHDVKGVSNMMVKPNSIQYHEMNDFLVWIDQQGFQDLMLNLLKQSLIYLPKEKDARIDIVPQRGDEGDDYNYLFIQYHFKKKYLKHNEHIKMFLYEEQNSSDSSWCNVYKPLLQAAGGNFSVNCLADGNLCVLLKFPKVD